MKQYGCLINGLRGFLIVYNALFLIAGCAFIAAGVIMCTDFKGFTQTLGPDLSVVPMLLAVIGSVIVILSVLGMTGGALPHSCVLVCYAGLLLLLVLGELSIGILTIVGQDKVKQEARVQMVNAMAHYPHQKKIKFGIDFLQKKFECCGFLGYKDWSHVLGHAEVPESCCKDPEHCVTTYNMTDGRHAVKRFQKKGCVKAVSLWAREHLVTVTTISLASCALQLLGISFSFILAYRVKAFVAASD